MTVAWVVRRELVWRWRLAAKVVDQDALTGIYGRGSQEGAPEGWHKGSTRKKGLKRKKERKTDVHATVDDAPPPMS